MAAQISYQPSVLQVGNVAFRGAAADLPVHDDVFNRASVALRDSRQQPLLALVQRQINGDMDVTINVTIRVTINAVEEAQLGSRS